MKVASVYNGYVVNKNFSALLKTNSQQWNELRVFLHHIYEYKKGLRNLVLTTEKETNKDLIIQKLEKDNISYLIQKIGQNKINVFFGNPASVEVIKSFNKVNLKEYTPEQDFMLGILLGYDKVQECSRYLSLIKK